MADNTQQRNQSLARIRDNQRRSRARRKEYLQELESRFRICEQTGAEASAEIQAAARKVMDENRRLRQLLKQQGISDADIDRMAADPAESAAYPNAVRALEGQLALRRPCGHGRPPPPPPPPSSSSSSHLAADGPPVPRPAATSPTATAPFAYDSPRLMTASTSSSVSTPAASNVPVSYPYAYGPVDAAAQLPAVDYSMPFDDPYAWGQYLAASQPPPPGGATCYMTAHAVRTLKPAAGFDLEASLACGDGQGMPNPHVFDMMDQYADRGV